MLDLNVIRNQPDLVKTAVAQRQNPELVSVVDEILALDVRRRAILKEVETLKAQRNAASKAISRMKNAAEREASIQEQKGIGEKITGLDSSLREVDERLATLQSTLPNLPDPRTPA